MKSYIIAAKMTATTAAAATMATAAEIKAVVAEEITADADVIQTVPAVKLAAKPAAADVTAIAIAAVIVIAMKTTARMIAILPAVREPLFFKNTKSVLNGHSRPDAMMKLVPIGNVP